MRIIYAQSAAKNAKGIAIKPEDRAHPAPQRITLSMRQRQYWSTCLNPKPNATKKHAGRVQNIHNEVSTEAVNNSVYSSLAKTPDHYIYWLRQ
jgi:hypothetical protein